MGAVQSTTTTSSMAATATSTSIAATATATLAPYTLQDDYLSGGNFFNQFTFFTDPDPTHGTVQYVNQSIATSLNMIASSASSVYIGAEYNKIQPSGRPSVRITSKKSYDSALVIVDLAHMPQGCGTWPAFWMLGPNWPNAGEIDIIEGVNDGTTNLQSLHTTQGCNITSAPMSGSIATSDCNVNSPTQGSNVGCGITTSNTTSFGTGFNSNGGGVYATRYSATNITSWYWGRKSIPADITSGNPNPAGWGLPVSQFSGCAISKYIKAQQIIINLTFCGDWAGNVWGSSSSCSAKASTCADYVQNNPSAFKDAYWTINSLKVYQPR